MRKFIAAAVLLIALGLAPSYAAVTVDNCTAIHPITNGSNINSYTVGAGLTGGVLVIAMLVTSNASITAPAASWDTTGTNQSMTLLVSANSGTSQIYIFGLRSPTAGNKTLVTSWTNTANVDVVGCSFQGVDVTNDTTAFPSASRVSTTNLAPIAIAVPSATGNIVFAGFGSAANFSSTTGVTGCSTGCDNTGGLWAVAGDYWATTGASTTVSASPGSVGTSVVGAIEIAQTAAGGTATPTRTLLGVGL